MAVGYILYLIISMKYRLHDKNVTVKNVNVIVNVTVNRCLKIALVSRKNKKTYFLSTIK